MPSGDQPSSPTQPPAESHPAPPTRPSYDLVDYLRVLRRGWWLLLLAVILGLAGALGVTAAQTKTYEAATSVLVLPTAEGDARPGGNRGNGINLDTEAQLVRSISTASAAKKLLSASGPPTELRDAVSVTVPPNTAILEISYAAPDPERARAGSRAFARAYLDGRQESTQAELDRRIAALSEQIEGVQKQLKEVITKQVEVSSFSSNTSYLSAQQQNLSTQLNSLANRLNELRATTLSGGRVISRAQLPTSPSHPSTPLNLAAGLMLGLLAGVSAALARQHTDRRIARGADVARRTGVPLLAELSGACSTSGVEAAFSAFTPAGRLFSRLRNEVMASLPPDQPALVVVTGACRGPAAATLAANLAVALARGGSDVALVYGDVLGAWTDATDRGAHTTRLFGVPVAPGLSEVLTGRAELSDALTTSPHHYGVRVLPTGGAASAAGLLQSETARQTLSALRAEAEYVIMHAPAASESADAQSLAIHADAVLLAVDLGRATDLQVADAAAQLQRVGTPLLGAVALPALPAPSSPSQRTKLTGADAATRTEAPVTTGGADSSVTEAAGRSPAAPVPEVADITDATVEFDAVDIGIEITRDIASRVGREPAATAPARRKGRQAQGRRR